MTPIFGAMHNKSSPYQLIFNFKLDLSLATSQFTMFCLFTSHTLVSHLHTPLVQNHASFSQKWKNDFFKNNIPTKCYFLITRFWRWAKHIVNLSKCKPKFDQFYSKLLTSRHNNCIQPSCTTNHNSFTRLKGLYYDNICFKQILRLEPPILMILLPTTLTKPQVIPQG